MKNIIIYVVLSGFATTSSMAADSMSVGADLYAQHCMACHGESGEGGMGVPLALPSLLGSVTDEYLVKTIRHGRPGRVMPEFPELGDEQVMAIVKHVRSMVDVPTPQISSDPVQGNVRRGVRVFEKHCARCHGANGEGADGTGVTISRPRDLPIMAPALNNTGFLSSADDHTIKRGLSRCREGMPLSSMRSKGLSEQDINDVVCYVRSFQGVTAVQEEVYPQGPVLMAESPYDIEQTLENLRQAVINHNFLLVRVMELDEGLESGGISSGRKIVVYFCNFSFLSEALKIDPRVGVFLPCRITLVERDGKVQVMSVNPVSMSKMFNNAGLSEYCKNMLAVYQALIEESVL